MTLARATYALTRPSDQLGVALLTIGVAVAGFAYLVNRTVRSLSNDRRTTS